MAFSINGFFRSPPLSPTNVEPSSLPIVVQPSELPNQLPPRPTPAIVKTVETTPIHNLPDETHVFAYQYSGVKPRIPLKKDDFESLYQQEYKCAIQRLNKLKWEENIWRQALENEKTKVTSPKEKESSPKLNPQNTDQLDKLLAQAEQKREKRMRTKDLRGDRSAIRKLGFVAELDGKRIETYYAKKEQLAPKPIPKSAEASRLESELLDIQDDIADLQVYCDNLEANHVHFQAPKMEKTKPGDSTKKPKRK